MSTDALFPIILEAGDVQGIKRIARIYIAPLQGGYSLRGANNPRTTKQNHFKSREESLRKSSRE